MPESSSLTAASAYKIYKVELQTGFTFQLLIGRNVNKTKLALIGSFVESAIDYFKIFIFICLNFIFVKRSNKLFIISPHLTLCSVLRANIFLYILLTDILPNRPRTLGLYIFVNPWSLTVGIKCYLSERFSQMMSEG